jgi:hypothetical protein
MEDQEGRFPRVRALHDYTALSDHELSFRTGDLLTVYDIRNEDWWAGEEGGDLEGRLKQGS